MNDVGSDAESAALTHEEAIQVLRLSPEGLRRLADLDEAIMELRAARRSLLANRLESIKDAFAAARKVRPTGLEGDRPEVANYPQPGKGRGPEVPPGESATSNGQAGEVDVVPLETPPANGHDGSDAPLLKDGRSALPGANGDAPLPRRENLLGAIPLQGELRMLRTEVAELRREVASLKGTGADANLQQIQRRLSYLEAELESRHL